VWVVEKSWSREIAVAVHAARKAAELALRYQPNVVAETKPDNSPVTEADRECERLIARLLSEAFPEDGLLGEEGTRVESRSGRRWIIDPIDGTREYLRGSPLWANLITLEAGDEMVVGVVNLPVLGSLYIGSLGGGAFRDNSSIHASSRTSLEEATLCIDAFNRFDAAPFKDRLLDWMTRFQSVRGSDGASGAMMVASGQVEIWIEPHASPWDFAPLKVIVQEAGGRFLNFDGGSSIYAGNCIVCAPAFGREVLSFLGLNS
jgi:histidinol phosphatase-like enzyme (inositol monophosphatase family)